MSEPTGFLAAGLIFALAVTVAVTVLWRLKKHASSRADAEARMSAAMQELQLLAAKLQAQKRASGEAGQPGAGSEPGPPPSSSSA